jgi:DNA transformation protein
MSQLTDLPNIGKIVAKQLTTAGIETAEQLLREGSIGAALRLEGAGFVVCENKLFALEGAIRGVRWHSIPVDERKALWAQFDSHRSHL